MYSDASADMLKALRIALESHTGGLSFPSGYVIESEKSGCIGRHMRRRNHSALVLSTGLALLCEVRVIKIKHVVVVDAPVDGRSCAVVPHGLKQAPRCQMALGNAQVT